MIRVLGYIRVSGRSQVDGDGFPRQKEAIQRFAESKGWQVARFFQEEAVSGTVESMDRPEFSAAISLCGGGQFDTLVVERGERLARDLIVSELLFKDCRERGVKVFSADSGEELVHADSDPTRKLIRQILGALSEWDKNMVVKKLRAARDRIRAEKGRCGGFHPLEVAHPEVVPLILEFREQGDSFRHIARRLNNRMRYPVPTFLKAGRWTPATIFDIYRRITKSKVSNEPLGEIVNARY